VCLSRHTKKYEEWETKKGARVVKWYEAGILSLQPGFDSRPDKTSKKNIKKPPGVSLMTASRKAYLKK